MTHRSQGSLDPWKDWLDILSFPLWHTTIYSQEDGLDLQYVLILK